MKLVFDRIETRCRRGRVSVDVENTAGIALSWTMGNDGKQTATVDAVDAVWRIIDSREPVRMFRHGYQSWSPSGWATFGVEADPSRAPGAIPLVADMHHADPAIAEPDELRSELVTVLDDGSDDPPLVVGFLGGTEHDGTFRLRRRDSGLELWAEASSAGSSWSVARSVAFTPSSHGRSTTTSVGRSTGGRRQSARPAAHVSPRRTRSVGAPGTTTSKPSPSAI